MFDNEEMRNVDISFKMIVRKYNIDVISGRYSIIEEGANWQKVVIQRSRLRKNIWF